MFDRLRFLHPPAHQRGRSRAPGIVTFSVALLALAGSIAPQALTANLLHSALAGDKPAVVYSPADDWRLAESVPYNGGLMLPLPARPTDGTVLAEVFRLIPNYFPEFKLNTISRGMHSSLLYLEDYSLDQVRELITFLKGLDAATLEAYDLLKPVRVFDPANIEFTIVGTKSKFLALKPPAEYVAWQLRFWKMLDERAPKFVMEHQRAHRNMGDKAVSAEAVHFSLIQWDASMDPALADEARINAQMKEVFEMAQANLEARQGRPAAPVLFDWKAEPLHMSQAPSSFSAGQLVNLAIKANAEGPVSVSKVVTFRVANEQGLTPEESVKLVEALTEDFLAGKTSASVPSRDYPLGKMQKLPSVDDATFTARIQDPRVAKSFARAATSLSPSWKPAAVPAFNSNYKDRFYVASEFHPGLEPQKTFRLLEIARGIGFKSTDEYSLGMSIYASSARHEIKNPSDIDLMLHTIAWVPESASDYESAKAAAVASFRKLVDQIRELDREGKIAITELRLGSNATMGKTTSGDPIEDATTNPYLSRDDIYRGYYIDETGRKWTLEELIHTGDFFKLKLDLFVDGKRQPISLQIGAGFSWRGNLFHLNQNGAKGIQPALRTAIYDGADAMAIALSLHRPYLYYAVQKYPMLPRAIGELRQAAKMDQGKLAWAPKFLKKFYGFLFLMRQNELRLENIFHQEVAAVLESQAAAVPSMDEIIKDLLQSINRKELAVLNEIKHVANDLREFNEMRHRFTDEQWTTRVEEIRTILPKLKQVAAAHRGDLTAATLAEYEASLATFERVLSELTRLSPHKATQALLAKSRFKPLADFENILAQLEIEITGAGLSPATKQFIEAYMRILPDTYEQYLDARAMETESRKKLTLRLMNAQAPAFSAPAAPSAPKLPALSLVDPCEGAFL